VPTVAVSTPVCPYSHPGRPPAFRLATIDSKQLCFVALEETEERRLCSAGDDRVMLVDSMVKQLANPRTDPVGQGLAPPLLVTSDFYQVAVVSRPSGECVLPL
jgi:hypothetical protein